MSGAATRSWRRQLARRRAAFRATQGLAALLLWLSAAALALLALLATDYVLALDPAQLAWLGRGTAAALGVALLLLLARAGGFTSRQLAVELDRRTADPRQPFLSALELSESQAPANGLQAFLADRALEHATERLRALPASITLPVTLLRRRALLCEAILAVTAAALLLPGPVTGLLIARYLHPYADLPPFSRFTFRVQPSAPVVIYGDDVELAVDVGGPEMPSGVMLLTRVNGAVQRTPCFAEGPRRYAQRVERVTGPVEFCFSTGRARSHWHRIAVNLEPRIAVARFTVAPPAYSRQPARSFVAGEAPLQALAGSRVRLELTCNRPLRDGALRLTPAAGKGRPQTVAGVCAGRHLVRFEWTLEGNATLDATVRDLQGTPNRVPYRLKQLVQPDARPVAVLVEPPPYALATPSTALKLAGYAEDDLGLRRVDLVRGLEGYHDRVRTLGPAAEVARVDLADTLDLGQLGVVPGQVLEFFVEADDTNPDESGRVASEVARVEIVSEEDYAQMLRERLDAEQFMARFQAAAAALQAARDAIQAAAAALESKDEAALAPRKRELAGAVARAETLFHTLANDFAIYDLEKEAQQAFRETAKALREAQAALQQAGDDRAKLAQALADAARRLAERGASVQQQVSQAQQVAEIARVLELEGVYRDLVAAQTELARRYRRHSDPARIRDAAFFRGVGEEQTRLHQALTGFQAALRERAAALPGDPELADLRRTALAFAKAIDTLRIPEGMSDAEQAAAAQDGVGSRDKVELVLELMRKLLKQQSEDNGFGAACKRPKFCPSESQNRTLKQLGQCRRPGLGRQLGLGWGGAGAGDDADGYSAGAATPLNIPMIGPPRAWVGGREGSGSGESGRNGNGPVVAQERAGERAAGPGAAADTEGAVRLDEVPDKYRDALKTYFGTLETRP